MEINRNIEFEIKKYKHNLKRYNFLLFMETNWNNLNQLIDNSLLTIEGRSEKNALKETYDLLCEISFQIEVLIENANEKRKAAATIIEIEFKPIEDKEVEKIIGLEPKTLSTLKENVLKHLLDNSSDSKYLAKIGYDLKMSENISEREAAKRIIIIHRPELQVDSKLFKKEWDRVLKAINRIK